MSLYQEISYSNLLVVDAYANRATRPTVVPAIQLEDFTHMVVAPDKWSHQGCVRWPLVNVIPVKDGVPLQQFAMQFNTNVTKALCTILATMVSFSIFTILPTRMTIVVVQHVRSELESQAEFRSWSHCPRHKSSKFSYSRKSSMTFL